MFILIKHVLPKFALTSVKINSGNKECFERILCCPAYTIRIPERYLLFKFVGHLFSLLLLATVLALLSRFNPNILITL